MSNPIDVIIFRISISINSFQFNSYAVLPGSILCKIQHSKHLATSCHFNLKERQSFWPRDNLFGRKHLFNMQIRNNFGFVLPQRTNDQHLSRIDWVSNFLWIYKEIHPILCLDPCHKWLEMPMKLLHTFSSFEEILKTNSLLLRITAQQLRHFPHQWGVRKGGKRQFPIFCEDSL